MKHLASILRLSVLAQLCGCGEGEGGLMVGPPSPDITGNWQFNLPSTVSGMPSVTIAGSITQSGSLVSGAVHLHGSDCFDSLTTIGLTGTLTDRNISLTSTSVEGQVVTLTGSITAADNAFAGSYSTNGGCANGEQGNVTGFKVLRVDRDWRGILVLPGSGGLDLPDDRCNVLATMSQGSASSEGTFSITGPVSVQCLVGGTWGASIAGTIIAGTFPSPSFIIGTSVSLEIETGAGTVVFRGTLNDAGTIIVGSFDGAFDSFSGAFGRGCFGIRGQGNCRP